MTTSGGGWVGWGGSLPSFAKKKINSSCVCIYKFARGRVEITHPTHPTHPRDARRCPFAAFNEEVRL